MNVNLYQLQDILKSFENFTINEIILSILNFFQNSKIRDYKALLS